MSSISSRRAAVTEELVELVIDSIGAQGDGVAYRQGSPVYIPFTAIGDRIMARIHGDRGSIAEILERGQGRRSPTCGHFGQCGGCLLQHLGTKAYQEWIGSRIQTAFARHGIRDFTLRPVVSVAPASRRRVDLKASRTRSGVKLGYNRRRSTDVVDMRECVVMDPAILSILGPLRVVLGRVLDDRRTASVAITHTDSGNDFLISTDRPLTLSQIADLTEFGREVEAARISWQFGDVLDTIACFRPPRVVFGRCAVELPPGAFLQPTIEGEHELARLIKDWVGGTSRIADLFSGCGTLSIPLADQASVVSFESDAAAVAAIRTVAKTYGIESQLRAERRDLHRNPLSAAELADFQAVVFDPPRAGARPQAKEIATSPVTRVVAVSCNPETLARDARLLLDGGYELCEVTPVDQFLWSGHLELVARFNRTGDGFDPVA